MMPSCSHTGTPSIPFDGFRHFTSSSTSGSACLMMARTRASVSPRQSPSFLIRASIRLAGESFPVVCAALFFVVAFVMMVSPVLHPFARQSARLLHPSGQLRLVDRFAFVNVEIAHALLLGLAGRERAQRCSVEE